jgi:hypothetical protein
MERQKWLAERRAALIAATPGSTSAVRSPHSADVGKSHEIKHNTPV